MQTKIILASGSKNRKFLLASLGVSFTAIPSDINENQINEDNPIKKVQAIAKAKAHKVAQEHKGIIIAVDTFHIYNGKCYQKPSTIEEAKQTLRELSGKDGQAVSGICIINTEANTEVVTYRAVDMHVKDLTDEEIKHYVHTKPVTQWAAAYNPLDKVSSTIFTPVGNYEYKIEFYGLPIDVVARELNKVGYLINLDNFKSNDS